MQKFTVFTLLLTVIVVVVTAQIVADEYLPSLKDKIDNFDLASVSIPEDLDLSKVAETNVLGADIDYSKIEDETIADGMVYEEMSLDGASADAGVGFGSGFEDSITRTDSPTFSDAPTPPPAANNSGISDFEDNNFVSYAQNVYLREDMIRAAGFATAYLEDEPHDGYLFKTIYVDDLNDVNLLKYAIRTQDALLAKAYVFDSGPLSGIEEVYEVLKVRGSQGLDIEINETNDFGNNSFYLNDTRRSEVAFLVVRYDSLIYAFSYPKNYHAQIKNLAQLIDMEF